MRTLQLTSCMALLLGGLLLGGTGCSKSIQANSGSKSFEPGAKKNVASAPAKPSGSKPCRFGPRVTGLRASPGFRAPHADPVSVRA